MKPEAAPIPELQAGRPDLIESEAALEEWLTRPRPELVQLIRSFSSPLLVLGAGGKMGPTLAVRARRATEAAGHPLEIIAVSRFSDPSARDWLEARGIRTLSCDLLDGDAVATLPDAIDLVYMVGLKFGTSRNPAATWAMNTLVPARICERFPGARVAALSTGNVYPLSEVAGGGAVEGAPLTPLGEYANAAVARERVFEFCSQRFGTRVALLRLSYAVELRYGVLVDIACKVHAGEPISLANGWVNCIWQGDANDAVLRALPFAESPPSVWNLCRREAVSVRKVAMDLGELLGRRPRFEGSETATALLSNPARLEVRLGEPTVTVEAMLPWIASWVAGGGRILGRPTHFENRDGQY